MVSIQKIFLGKNYAHKNTARRIPSAMDQSSRDSISDRSQCFLLRSQTITQQTPQSPGADLRPPRPMPWRPWNNLRVMFKANVQARHAEYCYGATPSAPTVRTGPRVVETDEAAGRPATLAPGFTMGWYN